MGQTAMPIFAKLDNTGRLLLKIFARWNPYDYGYAIAVDSSGNIFVAGNGSATWGAPLRAYNASGSLRRETQQHHGGTCLEYFSRWNPV